MVESGEGQELRDQRTTKHGHVVTGFPKGGDAGKCKTYNLMKPVFFELWSIYDEYIEALDDATPDQLPKDDLPWIYTERSIVGHLTAAAFRAGYVSIEEYQAERQGNKPMGRADWWLGTTDKPMESILVEAKQMWLSSEASNWGDLGGILNRAGQQLEGYDADEQSKEFHKLIMCFVRPYFRGGHEIIDETLMSQLRTWCDEDAYWPEGTDYFTCYWLKSVKGRGVEAPDHKQPRLYRPGLFICCREIPRAHKTA